MANRLKKNIDLLKVLSKSDSRLRKAILANAGTDTVRCICDCTHNVLNGNLKLTPKQRRNLTRHRAALRQLTNKSVGIEQKRKLLVQRGGLVSAVLAPILAIAASLLAEKWMR